MLSQSWIFFQLILCEYMCRLRMSILFSLSISVQILTSYLKKVYQSHRRSFVDNKTISLFARIFRMFKITVVRPCQGKAYNLDFCWTWANLHPRQGRKAGNKVHYRFIRLVGAKIGHRINGFLLPVHFSLS